MCYRMFVLEGGTAVSPKSPCSELSISLHHGKGPCAELGSCPGWPLRLSEHHHQIKPWGRSPGAQSPWSGDTATPLKGDFTSSFHQLISQTGTESCL